MTMKLTDRDKKLLVFLAIFLIVVGLGVGVIYPLAGKSQELSEKLLDATLEKTEREQKVSMAAVMEKNKEKALSELEAEQSEFYEILPSMGIDKMLTEMAVARGVVVSDLDISMPVQGEYAQLVDYFQMLENRGKENSDSEEKGDVYGGIYMAEAEISMNGSRQALQEVLDACAALEPKARVSEFLWQDNRKGENGEYTLSISLELYMAQGIDQYVMEQQMAAQEDQENSADTAEEEE